MFGDSPMVLNRIAKSASVMTKDITVAFGVSAASIAIWFVFQTLWLESRMA